MPKSLINENREGLIIGSACEAGELFQAVVDGKDWDELKRIASWYDYLEIQPLCNNMFMLRKGMVQSQEELKDFNRTIVRLGRRWASRCAPPATSISWTRRTRSTAISCWPPRAFEDADESLPIYFKTTTEMLEEFAYLGKEKAYEVVVTNTNLVADWCEDVVPLPQGLFAPKIENSAEELTSLVWGKAHELYGEKPPKIVVDRINAELGDIIKCKYDVIYMSAQKLVQDSPGARLPGGLPWIRGLVSGSLHVGHHGGELPCLPTTAVPSASTRTSTPPKRRGSAAARTCPTRCAPSAERPTPRTASTSPSRPSWASAATRCPTST